MILFHKSFHNLAVEMNVIIPRDVTRHEAVLV